MDRIHKAIEEWYRFPSSTFEEIVQISQLSDDQFIEFLEYTDASTRANILKSERCRWKTFRTSWGRGNNKPGRNLVVNGFYYLNNGSVVHCTFCGLVMNGRTDDPGGDHRTKSPSCTFYQGDQYSGNIKFDHWGIRVKKNDRGLPDDIMDATESLVMPEFSPMDLKCLMSNPSYPEKRCRSARVATFQEIGWNGPKYEKLCDAGHFFDPVSGVTDKTTCYCCDGSLENWQTYDNPFVEHAKVYFKCPLIIHLMGKHFVETVQASLSAAEKRDYDQFIYFGYHMPPVRSCSSCKDQPAELHAQPCGHKISCRSCQDIFLNSECPMKDCEDEVVEFVVVGSPMND